MLYDGGEDAGVNENGRQVLQMCDDNNLVVVNNLKFGDKHFRSNLSFRKKNVWISEPDILITSKKGLQIIESFNMVQYFEGKHLFSDHALLEFEINMEKVKISTGKNV